ncbi:hypothetical protein D3C72_2312080 [compost metagenome]
MTTDNEREKAQLERAEAEDETELALMVVEVAGRDEKGRISQVRNQGEATEAEANDLLKKRIPKA